MLLNNGCNSSLESSTGVEQRISDLERQVKELKEQTAQGESKHLNIDKDIPVIRTTVGNPEWKNTQGLTFKLSAGDRVNGEVIITSGADNLISTIKDPFGNVLMQSATKENTITYTTLESGKRFDTYLTSIQTYPWRFAFISAVTGDYVLEIYKEITSSGESSAKVRMNIN